MTDQSMQQQLEQFIDQLDRYGDQLDDWPEAAATAARALLSRSPAAQQALAEASAVSSALAELPQLAAPRELLNRIAARPPADRWEQLQNWFSAALWRPLLAGAAPLVAGFLLGFTLAPDSEEMMVDQLSLLTLSSDISAAEAELEEYEDDF